MSHWPFADSPNHADVDQLLEPRPFPTVDLQAVAKAGISKPILLFHGLLYRGMLHSLAGPPDSGKTTIALRAALDLLAQGETVDAPMLGQVLVGSPGVGRAGGRRSAPGSV